MPGSPSALPAALLVLLAVHGSARAETVTRCSFADADGFSLNGEGFTQDGRLILTDAADADHSTVFWDSPITWSAETSFASRLRFLISGGPAGERGAGDGLAFVVHSNTEGAAAIYGDGTQGSASIVPAVLVRFDTLRNYDNDDPGAEDASDNQIEVAAAGGGAPSLEAIVPAPVDLDAGAIVTVAVRYDAGALRVEIDGALVATQELDPAVFLGEGEPVWFGVTAFGSSALAPANRHELLEFQFTTEGLPCGCGAECPGGLVCEADVCVDASPATGGAEDEAEGCGCRSWSEERGGLALAALLAGLSRRRRPRC